MGLFLLVEPDCQSIPKTLMNLTQGYFDEFYHEFAEGLAFDVSP
jgi:hypothetical protein